MQHRIILLSKKSHRQVKFNSNIKFKIKKKPHHWLNRTLRFYRLLAV